MEFGIIFDSASILLDALKRIKYVEPSITPQSANAHILLEQADESHLFLTAYGVGGIWMQQVISSTQAIVGTKHLILASDLHRIHNSIKGKYGVAFAMEEGALTLSSVNGYTEGEPSVLDTVIVQQFHGAMNEFGPPVFLEQPHIKLEASEFLSILQLCRDFGGFALAKELRGVYVRVKSGQAEFYTNQAFNPQYLLKAVIACECENEFEFILNGKHLDPLIDCFESKKVGETAAISVGDDLVTVTGTLGRVTAKTLSPERFLSLTSAPLNFEPHPLLKEYGYRTFTLKRMTEAIEAQEPTKDHQGKALKIHAKDDLLIVSKLADARLRERSFVTCQTLEELQTEFPVLSYTAKALLQSLATLNSLRQRQSLASEVVKFRVVRNTKMQERWGLYATLASETKGNFEIFASLREPREGDI